MRDQAMARSGFFLVMACLLPIVFVAGPASAAGVKFSGAWVDQQNADIKMNVREDAGIFKITGGDKAYGYQVFCLLKGVSAVCTGSGGRLEGEKFLYQSTFEIGNDGTATERWKAFNNLQTVSGSTMWKRP